MMMKYKILFLEECDWDEYNNSGPNYQTLNGALVGGPDQNDNYNDDRGNYISNEVATDYNAGFQSTMAYLSSISGEDPQPTDPTPTEPPVTQPIDPTSTELPGTQPTGVVFFQYITV
jgi:hypothetical protein